MSFKPMQLCFFYLGAFHFLGSVPGTSGNHTGLTNCTPLVPGTRCARSKIYPQIEIHPFYFAGFSGFNHSIQAIPFNLRQRTRRPPAYLRFR